MFFLFKCKRFLNWSNFLQNFTAWVRIKTTLNRMTGFHTPIYFINESIILKNESFCVVCIITYVTLVLLFKDGSNTLHVIFTCILLFTLFRCCCISIIVLTRWIGWLKQQQVAKDKIYIFFVFKHNIFSLQLDDLCPAHLLLL